MAKQRREQKKVRESQARRARLEAQRKRRMTKTITVIAVLAVAVTGAGAMSALGGGDTENAASTTTTTTTAPPAPCPAADGSTERRIDFPSAPSTCIDASKKYTAELDTTEGKVVVDLDTSKTPGTTNNFVYLSRYHYYDGTQIFRTDPSIDIIQGGSPHTESASDQGPGYNIEDEGNADFKYKEGDLVMARSAGADSASAQYFFATGPQVSNLDEQGTYVVFGKTTQGLDVLKKIIGLHQPTGELGGKPSKTVTVNKVTITET